ncbi:hypothetical protein D3C81_1696680 [compost metagenome]
MLELTFRVTVQPDHQQVRFQRDDPLHIDLLVAADTRDLQGFCRIIAIANGADDAITTAGGEYQFGRMRCQ